MGKEAVLAGKTGRRGRVSRWAQTDEPLCRLIIDYASAHPNAKPREIAQALNISNGKGNYVSQVLYRHRHLRRNDEPQPSPTPPPVSREERNQILGEAINYIQEVSKTFQSGGDGDALPVDKAFQAEYETLKNLLGRLMTHLLRNKAIDRNVIRDWVFNTLTIRSVDEYDLFMKVVFDENSWLYQEKKFVESMSKSA
jgi:hypothetical protein